MGYAQELLTMGLRWREAWDNEQGPLLEDLATLEAWCKISDHKQTGVPTGDTRQWVNRCLEVLSELTDQLADGQFRPEAAVDVLDNLADQLRLKADWLVQEMIVYYEDKVPAWMSADAEDARDGYWKAESKARYRGKWHIGETSGTYDPDQTLRVNINHSPELVAAYAGVCAPVRDMGRVLMASTKGGNTYYDPEDPGAWANIRRMVRNMLIPPW